MEIKTAEFVISNTDYKKCPESQLPEYAFIGRSNVGKSSLINMLCNRKDLAMTSSKPGKTLLINHFLINNNWHLVDVFLGIETISFFVFERLDRVKLFFPKTKGRRGKIKFLRNFADGEIELF